MSATRPTGSPETSRPSWLLAGAYFLLWPLAALPLAAGTAQLLVTLGKVTPFEGAAGYAWGSLTLLLGILFTLAGWLGYGWLRQARRRLAMALGIVGAVILAAAIYLASWELGHYSSVRIETIRPPQGATK